VVTATQKKKTANNKRQHRDRKIKEHVASTALRGKGTVIHR
jgi:hypothetical protein